MNDVYDVHVLRQMDACVMFGKYCGNSLSLSGLKVDFIGHIRAKNGQYRVLYKSLSLPSIFV